MVFLSERHKCLKKLGTRLSWEMEEVSSDSGGCGAVTGSWLEQEDRTIPAFGGSSLRSREEWPEVHPKTARGSLRNFFCTQILLFLPADANCSPPHTGSSPREECFLDRLDLFGSSCVALNCSRFRACGGAPQSNPGPVNGLQEVPWENSVFKMWNVFQILDGHRGHVTTALLPNWKNAPPRIEFLCK